MIFSGNPEHFRQGCLTGHLVFSTLHTNTATGAITRLRDMGIEPFLLSSTICGILAQRLVRLLCPHCRQSYQATTAECRELGVSAENPPQIYRAVGCRECRDQGYLDRTSLYEFVEMTGKMAEMIHEQAGEHEMEKYARSLTPSLGADGIRRVLLGDTTLSEVLRVSRGNQDLDN
jgi:general secretion pathway protein E